ncbi:hypothetical protein ACP70R_004815 [Stipagrostis hirtigluma subsp. patula]
MRWDATDAEAVLERIWDLHDRLSDAILAASRAHLLLPPPPPVPSAAAARRRNDCIFVKAGGGEGGATLAAAVEAVAEARGLHAIRSGARGPGGPPRLQAPAPVVAPAGRAIIPCASSCRSTPKSSSCSCSAIVDLASSSGPVEWLEPLDAPAGCGERGVGACGRAQGGDEPAYGALMQAWLDGNARAGRFQQARRELLFCIS